MRTKIIYPNQLLREENWTQLEGVEITREQKSWFKILVNLGVPIEKVV